MNKGISPLIAAVLLIAFTMSIAILVGPFFTQTLKDTQEGQDQKANDLVNSGQAQLEIKDTKFNSDNGNYTVTVKNSGTEPISNFTTTVYGDEPTQKVVSKTLNPGEVYQYEVATGSTTKADKISVGSSDTGSSTDEQDLEDTDSGSAPTAPSGLTVNA